MTVIEGIKLFDINDLMKLTIDDPSVYNVARKINNKDISFEDMDDAILLSKDLESWEYYFGNGKITLYSRKAINQCFLISEYKKMQEDSNLLAQEFDKIDDQIQKCICTIYEVVDEQKESMSGHAFMKLEHDDGSWSFHLIPSLANFIKFLASSPQYLCAKCGKALLPSQAFILNGEINCEECKSPNFEPIY